MTDAPTRKASEADAPLQDFSDCHAGFVTVLETSLGLPEMIATAARSRACAADMLKMFHDRLLAHHDDEERDLFPAVIRVAQPGDEAERARAMVAQLVREHREIAQVWKRLEPSVQAIANGYLPRLDAALLQELVSRFNEHVRVEEEEFLPFAQRVLARQAEDMAMLGLALHRRHAVEEIMVTAAVYGAN
jgi:iron-sulfur cluster repair protein YtfE (RIC family)